MPGLTSHELHVKITNHSKLVYKGRNETTCDAWKAQNCCSCVCSWCPLLALTCPTGGRANVPERRVLAGTFSVTVTPTAPSQEKPVRDIEISFLLQCNYFKICTKKSLPWVPYMLLCSFFWSIQVEIPGNLSIEVESAFRTLFQLGSTQHLNVSLLN